MKLNEKDKNKLGKRVLTRTSLKTEEGKTTKKVSEKEKDVRRR